MESSSPGRGYRAAGPSVRAIPVDDLAIGGANAPINDYETADLAGITVGSAARLQKQLPGDVPLDALIVNRGTSVVVVALHGATDRAKTQLPRFEWLRSMLEYEVSCIFFGDPSLHLSPKLLLAWYTGWETADVQAEVAAWSKRIADAIGATRVIFMGASGGGFAALQTSALLDGSEALAFNAQTDIARYRVNGESWGVQRDYIQTVWPGIWNELATADAYQDGSWASIAGERVSAVTRYSSRRRNLVHLVQNEEEFHYDEHFLPFIDAARAAGNEVLTHTNREGSLHNPPRQVTFQRHMADVLGQ